MVTAGDFKNGLTIEYEGNIYQIIEFQHVKPGKGAAFVRTKMKNIKNECKKKWHSWMMWLFSWEFLTNGVFMKHLIFLTTRVLR